MKKSDLKTRLKKAEENYNIYKKIELRQDKIKIAWLNNIKIIKMLLHHNNFKDAEKIRKYNDKLSKHWEKSLILSNYYFNLWLSCEV